MSCDALVGTPHRPGCRRAHGSHDKVRPVDIVHDPMPPGPKPKRQAHYIVGRLDDALRGVDPEYVGSPLETDEVRPFLVEPSAAANALTVELKSSRMGDHEAEQEVWEVVLAGDGGDVTFAASTSREFAHAEATHLVTALNIALGDGAADLELP